MFYDLLAFKISGLQYAGRKYRALTSGVRFSPCLPAHQLPSCGYPWIIAKSAGEAGPPEIAKLGATTESNQNGSPGPEEEDTTSADVSAVAARHKIVNKRSFRSVRCEQYFDVPEGPPIVTKEKFQGSKSCSDIHGSTGPEPHICTLTLRQKRARQGYDSDTTYLKEDSFKGTRTLRQLWYTFRNFEWINPRLTHRQRRASPRPGSLPTRPWIPLA